MVIRVRAREPAADATAAGSIVPRVSTNPETVRSGSFPSRPPTPAPTRTDTISGSFAPSSAVATSSCTSVPDSKASRSIRSCSTATRRSGAWRSSRTSCVSASSAISRTRVTSCASPSPSRSLRDSTTRSSTRPETHRQGALVEQLVAADPGHAVDLVAPVAASLVLDLDGLSAVHRVAQHGHLGEPFVEALRVAVDVAHGEDRPGGAVHQGRSDQPAAPDFDPLDETSSRCHCGHRPLSEEPGLRGCLAWGRTRRRAGPRSCGRRGAPPSTRGTRTPGR